MSPNSLIMFSTKEEKRFQSILKNISSYKKLLASVGEGDQKAHFSIASTLGEGTTPFPGLLHFTFDTYLIMLSVKQGGIKYHFKSLWYDATGIEPRSTGQLANTLPT